MSAQHFVLQGALVTGEFRKVIDGWNRDFGVTTEALLARASEESGHEALDARSALLTYFFAWSENSQAHAELGAFEASMQAAMQAVQIAAAADLLFLRVFAEGLPGRVLLRRGQIDEAIPFLERGVGLARDADFPNALLNTAGDLGHAYNLAQRTPDAISVLQHAWALAEAGGFLYYGLSCLMHLADAYSLTGERTEAIAAIDRALAMSRNAGYRAREAWALYLRGNILARGAQADAAAARQAYCATLPLATELGMRPLVAHCYLGLGTLDREINTAEQACERCDHDVPRNGRVVLGGEGRISAQGSRSAVTATGGPTRLLREASRANDQMPLNRQST
jgi:tetratricopeptide (TPR) repeat protein